MVVKVGVLVTNAELGALDFLTLLRLVFATAALRFFVCAICE